MTLSSEEVDEAWQLGQAAYPDLPLGRDVFAAYLGERADAAPERAPDLYLACACLHGVAGAAGELTRRYLSRIGAHLGRLAKTVDVAEVRQALAIQLLVGTGGRPGLAEYAGRAPLGAWLRVLATRLALHQRRGESRRSTWEHAAADEHLDVDGELAVLKASYREPFARAFAAAATDLERPHRAVLRLHYVEGVTTARLAELHAVSRTTIVRRLTEAREALVAGTMTRLAALVGIPEDEFAAVLRLVRSQLDLDLRRLLASSTS